MSLAEGAKKHAEQQQKGEGMEMAMKANAEKSLKEKLTSREGWKRIADAFFMEWKMVYKEIIFGFTVAGFISVFVPQSFWNMLFLVSGGDGGAPGF